MMRHIYEPKTTFLALRIIHLHPPPERAIHSSVPFFVSAASLATSRRVQDTRASSTTSRLVPRCVFCTRPDLAPVARLDRRRARALVGAPRSRARNPAVCEAVTPLRRAVARGGDDRTAETRAIGVSARAFFFPNHRRASSDPARIPTAIADSSARRASGGFISSANMGGSAGGFDTTKVWSPAGGWFADPKYWKRNTMLGFAFLGVASATIFNYSRQVEQRPLAPTRRIPSQGWCANFPEGSPEKS